jgi:BASS family bile acid:Na+ symporter
MFISLQKSTTYALEFSIAGVALVICLLQFWFGRRIGKKYNSTVAGGQGLGQKNTILAIWLTQTYLNPVASIGPGSYVLWQNIVNSYQLWRKERQIKQKRE